MATKVPSSSEAKLPKARKASAKPTPPGRKPRGPGRIAPLPPDWRERLREHLIKSKEFPAALRGRNDTVAIEDHLRKYFGFPSLHLIGNAFKSGGLAPRHFTNIESKAKLAGNTLYQEILKASEYQLDGEKWVKKPMDDDKTQPFSFFTNRAAIEGNSELIYWLESPKVVQLDIVALSAAVLTKVYTTRFNDVLINRNPEVEMRVVVFDPSEANQLHYEGLVQRVLKEDCAGKAIEFKALRELAKTYSKKLKVKVIRNQPLQYNMWLVRGADGKDLCAHLSVYFYNDACGGPLFRFRKEHQMIEAMRLEFEHVWETVAVDLE